MDGPVSGRKGMSIRWFLTTLALSIAGSVAHADLQDTVGQVKKSIVIVGTFRATDSPRFNLRGTGFVAGNGKQVVTNAHVLPEGNDALQERSLVVQIRDANGEWQIRKAYVGAMDSVHDLVVLKIDGDPIAALNVRDSGGVREGQSVAFMGFTIGGALGFRNYASCDAHTNCRSAQRESDQEPACWRIRYLSIGWNGISWK
jgi:serine protease Do